MVEQLFMESPFLTAFGLAYVFLAVSKTILCLVSAPLAARHMAANHPEVPAAVYAVLVPLALVLFMPLYVLFALREEGLSFFALYDDEVVIEQINRGNAN